MSLQSASTYIHLHDRTGVKTGQTLPAQPVKYIDRNDQLLAWREQLYKEKKGKKSWYYKHQGNLLNDLQAKKQSYAEFHAYRNTPFSNVGTVEDLKNSRRARSVPPSAAVKAA
ncbi:unnamed protein product [Amoebophrya sp. A120]|nr:unnamed protein product [Amoebophrya sp. A120]|eukprot:GSA120T00014095001.1